MADINTVLGWSDPTPWGQDRDPHAKPENIKPETWVRSDLIVRPEKVGAAQDMGYPAFYSDQIWRVHDGESFVLDCPDAIATHTVASYYRLWAGELPDEIEDDTDAPISDELSEEELLRALMDAQTEGDRV
ncbi:hypothetical protein [Ruegeria sp. Ofav3-42]|uniref:hypothetical protein n=1 Tax=Ruegeria sp. Ofav3-42 TaxID=2917759 RepID=UPI001EF3F760|nr:hypothetical protein [Ruegeria sp. Ofav3-42]MCG7521604.1 hypothetical protein [Ruegeria sp. Ofav3-42]